MGGMKIKSKAKDEDTFLTKLESEGQSKYIVVGVFGKTVPEW